VFLEVDQVELVAGLDAVAGEVDEDVVALLSLRSPSPLRSMLPSKGTACSIRLPSLATMWNGTRA